MTALVFDVTSFRAQFSAFANTTTYPDVTLHAYWDAATDHISANDYGWLSGSKRQRALNLMTAHLVMVSQAAAKGKASGVVQSSTVDKVSVTLVAVPVKDEWSWWLASSPYGMQLLVLLRAHSVGGCFIGGRQETSAFRKVGGTF